MPQAYILENQKAITELSKLIEFRQNFLTTGSIYPTTEDEEKQKEIAEKSKAETEKSGLWDDPIVTEISQLKNYYKAEDYHQDYFAKNPNAGYCSVVIAPKVKKFKKEFSYLLKKQYQ